MHLGRIEFNIVVFMDWSFASGCSPPRLSTTQLPSATDRPVFPSGKDFHPSVGAYFQAHLSWPFGPQRTTLNTYFQTSNRDARPRPKAQLPAFLPLATPVSCNS